jgi:cell division protein FtsL
MPKRDHADILEILKRQRPRRTTNRNEWIVLLTLAAVVLSLAVWIVSQTAH